MLVQKIAMTVLGLIVTLMGLLAAAFSFGLGQTVQNAVMIAECASLLVWLYFIWRGRWAVALVGIAVTLVVGVFIIPFVSR